MHEIMKDNFETSIKIQVTVNNIIDLEYVS